MPFLGSMDISGSALTAQRMRMDVIAENLANINTTRDANGNPYRRRFVTMEERQGDFSSTLSKAMNSGYSKAVGNGVRVTTIQEDTSPFQLKYDPEHPDADEMGYVQMPNVDLATEMIDMMSASRAYEANITAVNAIKNMAMQALNIGK